MSKELNEQYLHAQNESSGQNYISARNGSLEDLDSDDSGDGINRVSFRSSTDKMEDIPSQAVGLMGNNENSSFSDFGFSN